MNKKKNNNNDFFDAVTTVSDGLDNVSMMELEAVAGDKSLAVASVNTAPSFAIGGIHY